MKLSFSTKGWHDASWEDFLTAAQDLGDVRAGVDTESEGSDHDIVGRRSKDDEVNN